MQGDIVRGCTDYTQEARGWVKPARKPPRAKRVTLFVLVVAAVVISVSSLWPKQNADGFSIESQAKVVESDATSVRSEPGDKPSVSTEKAESRQVLVVYITGAVANPGVYELEVGGRLNDAVNMAGGLADGAAINYINLASTLKDGVHIHIPYVSEIESGEAARIVSNGAAGITEASNPSGTEKAPQIQLVNINTATATELETLPGVGPVIAKRIIDYREKYGAYKNIGELKNVSGIGDKTFEGLADRICV